MFAATCILATATTAATPAAADPGPDVFGDVQAEIVAGAKSLAALGRRFAERASRVTGVDADLARRCRRWVAAAGNEGRRRTAALIEEAASDLVDALRALGDLAGRAADDLRERLRATVREHWPHVYRDALSGGATHRLLRCQAEALLALRAVAHGVGERARTLESRGREPASLCSGIERSPGARARAADATINTGS